MSAAKPDKLLHTFLRYLVSGGLATGVHFAVLIALLEYQLTPPVQATMLGAAGGFLVNYHIQFHWTFKVSGPHKRFFTRYLLISALMFGLNVQIFWLATTPEPLLLLGSVPYPSQIPQPQNIAYWYAQIIATGVVFLCNFLANRYFTFSPINQAKPVQ
ncbi:MAG: GtrA family protein [Methyloprofundus sp.]|nr:GtrA family protein [Methyloprofundus sp.]